MATPRWAVLYLGALAVLATLGLFINSFDRITRTIMGFAAAFLWGMFGFVNYNVAIVSSGVTTTFEVMPLVAVGFALAFLLFFYALNELLNVVRTSARSGELSLR